MLQTVRNQINLPVVTLIKKLIYFVKHCGLRCEQPVFFILKNCCDIEIKHSDLAHVRGEHEHTIAKELIVAPFIKMKIFRRTDYVVLFAML